MSKLAKYGPAVLGQQKFDEIQKQTVAGRDTFGPAVTGYQEKKEEAPKEPAHLSVRALQTVLEADPNKMDFYLSAEWEREGGARRSALRIFLAMEAAKENPRQVLIDRLTEAMGS